MSRKDTRRKCICQLATGSAAAAAYTILSPLLSCNGQRTGAQTETTTATSALFFKISLAEWSLNRALFGGQLDHLDFPLYAKENFGIDAVEYVNQFFMDKDTDQTYLGEMKTRCDDNGIRSVPSMCEPEGARGDVLQAPGKD